MNVDGPQQTKERKTHFLNLLKMARIDGHVHMSELEHLFSVGDQWGVTVDEAKAMWDLNATVTYTIPADDDERFKQLHEIIEMMLVDGHIHVKEMEFCLQIAPVLGFRQTLVHKLVERMVDGQEHGEAEEHLHEAVNALLHKEPTDD